MIRAILCALLGYAIMVAVGCLGILTGFAQQLPTILDAGKETKSTA